MTLFEDKTDTVKRQVSVYPPSEVVTVIVDWPAETPVISPELALTVATAVALEDQDTVLLVAFAGEIVGVKVVVAPTPNEAVASSDTPVTAIFVTVMEEVAVTLAFIVEVAVIVAEPAATPVTTPDETVAILLFEVDQVTEVLAPEGEAVTVNV